MTPTDQDCYFGKPFFPELMPKYDEVHVSVVFTWDIEKGYELKAEWEKYFDVVKIGGPAFNDSGSEFTPGMYLRKGAVITSRGCPNKCKFCFVPKREGDLRELKVRAGNLIQDNNILACSKNHLRKVFRMLRFMKGIEFKGGLESRRVTPKIAEELRSLRIKELWLACDYSGAEKPLKKAVETLTKAGFTRSHLRCYVLSMGKDMQSDEERVREVWNIGCMPFMQLYKPADHSAEWQRFQRKWSRPAIIRSVMTL
jgi:hypothetical protein